MGKLWIVAREDSNFLKLLKNKTEKTVEGHLNFQTDILSTTPCCCQELYEEPEILLYMQANNISLQ